MKIFVCEFITGGGMQDADLPSNLVREGDLMLKALLTDLLETDFKEIYCTRDTRLETPEINVNFITPEIDAWNTWQHCMDKCDAVWLIAPETGNILYDLTCMAQKHKCVVIGCTPDAVKVTSSKRNTIEMLVNRGIPCVGIVNEPESGIDNANGWVVKPDDGVGGEGCYLYSSFPELESYIQYLPDQSFIVQEYVPGKSASISLLSQNDHIKLLSCNEQLFEFRNGRGHSKGLIVNGLNQHENLFIDIAKKVVSAIKGLNGYIGIDLVLSETGPLVLEVNPRLTTAYAGLRQSIGTNPASLILESMQNPQLIDGYILDNKPVTIMI